MKRKHIAARALADAVPVACGMIAIACATPTAFKIEFLPFPLILFCIYAALLLSFWMNVQKYGFGFGAVLLTSMVLICVFRLDLVADGAAGLSYRILTSLPRSFSETFGIDLNRLFLRMFEAEDLYSGITVMLMLITGTYGILLAFALIRSKLPFLTMLMPLPMILLSLYYPERPPALWTIVLLTVYFGCAMLGICIRKGDSPRRSALFAILSPTLLIMGLLIIAIFPQDRFEPITPRMRDSLVSDWFGEIADTALSWIGRRSPNDIDLSEQGDREESDEEIFSVSVSRTGAFLLRTHSYGSYQDSQWLAAKPYRGDWRALEALGERNKYGGSGISIYGYVSDERVAPYAFEIDRPGEAEIAASVSPYRSETDELLDEESYLRSNGKTRYEWRFTAEFDVTPKTVTKEEEEYYAYACKTYTMKSGDEKNALLGLLRISGIKKTDDSYETAKEVASYVMASGTYSLSPGKLPKGRDFVQYFLTEGHTGYCIHFASATTALLQAMDIPARYTVGYYVPIESSRDWHSVTKRAEHAWTEVYILGVGWVPFESTPGFEPGGEKEHEQPIGTQARETATPAPTAAAAVTPEPSETPEAAVPMTEEPTLAPNAAPTAVPEPDTDQTATGGEGTGTVYAGASKARVSLWWLLIPVVPILWVGTGLLIRKRREARFRDPNVKRSIPYMARYLRRLERLKIPKDPDAQDWAVEAAFSNHAMKEEHRELLKRVHKAQREAYGDKPILHFLLRWVIYII